MIIKIPFPAVELMPNRKNGHHWAKTNTARAKAKQDAYFSALSIYYSLTASEKLRVFGREFLPLSLVFYMPDRRRRDADNLLAACKPALDGIAAALGVDDSRFKPIHVDWAIGEKPGAVIVSICEPLEWK